MTLLADNPSDTLRQGDVCTVDHFPQWDVEKSPSLTLPNGTVGIQLAAWSPVQSAPGGGHLVVVCSHDCDVENPRSRTGILLAPLVKVPASHASPEYERIMGSGEVAGEELAYINFFPLELPVEEGDPSAVVADFSAIIAMGRPSSAIPKLVSTKLFEMDDFARSNFKTKLAAFVGRP